MDSRSNSAPRWALAAVLLIAAVLRFGAVGHGLPRTDLFGDERITRARVVRSEEATRLSTPKYNWPQLNVHLSRPFVHRGQWAAERLGFPARSSLWWGRVYTATLGTLTVLLVYLLAANLLGPRVGLAAAAALTLMPLHVNRSRLWLPDVPMTAAYVLALLAAVWAQRRPTVPRFAAAGAAVGVCAALKYNGALSCFGIVIVAILWARETGGRASWLRAASLLAVAAVASVVAFIVADPAVVGSLDQLVYGVRWVGDIYTGEPSTGFLGWRTVEYIVRSFFSPGWQGVGPWLCLLSMLGTGLLAARQRRVALLALGPGLLYLVAYSVTLNNPFERSFLPLLPHLAIAAGAGVVWICDTAAARVPRRLAAGIGALLLVPALPAPLIDVVGARQGDTRLEALDWMRENVPTGASVLHEWDLPRPPVDLYRSRWKSTNLYKLAGSPEDLADDWDYVMACGRAYERVFRQRRRDGFADRARLYEELFDHPGFEEVRRVVPGVRRFGPEVRIFRVRPGRGPSFPRDRDLWVVDAGVWTRSGALRSDAGPGAYRLRTRRDRVAGRFLTGRPGCYSLEFRGRARRPFWIRASIGRRESLFELGTDAPHRLLSDRTQGQVWWEIAVAPGQEKGVARIYDLQVRFHEDCGAGGALTGPAG